MKPSLDTRDGSAENPTGVSETADLVGAEATDPPSDSAETAQPASRRPETAAERRARRTAYLAQSRRDMAEHARQLRAREER